MTTTATDTHLTSEQLPGSQLTIIEEQLDLYGQRRSITEYNRIPDTTKIPIADPLHWLKVKEVVCIFVDMKGSTQLSATTHDNGTAGAYQLFTATAVRLFHEMGARYIDVRGDGVFALYNFDEVYKAIAAAVSFKTFAHYTFAAAIKEKTGLDIDAHIGIDQKTVLVRKVGFKTHADRSDRQNEVWAGKPVNMASKLAAMGGAGDLLVSDRYFKKITDRRVRQSCGCGNGEATDLWEAVDVSTDPKFDFDTAYRLKSEGWCKEHGKEFYENIVALDD